ncbi:hypothetical protein [Coleofasciculus sp. F4-SAH-05]|uniref:hypothetical protein n=1 Tax=Coleofasciculus sp. F4-SAH-05 TaxID=3069525 RepID=UPI0033009705
MPTIAPLLERRSSIPRNRVSRQDDNAISTFNPKKPGFLTDILGEDNQALPYIASNDITVFSILDTSTGIVSRVR